MERTLMDTAKQLFGERRAGELQAEIARLAADLETLQQFPVTIDDAV